MSVLDATNVDGVCRLVINLAEEPVNKITRDLRVALQDRLDDARADTRVKAVVLVSAKPGSFLAGADIDEFVALRSADDALRLVRDGQAILSQLANLGKPIVAAIRGACLGGGLEAALACTYRVAADDAKTSLGLPEVQLGILPAAGGCQRLPRLIGVEAALDIILAGKTVPARRAHRLGIVDELVHPAILERVAMEAARRLGEGWRPRRRGRGWRHALLNRNPIGRRLVFRMAGRTVRKRTGGHYPAPLAALDAVQVGYRRGLAAGLEREAHHFAELATGDVSRKLVQIFFATTALKKDAGVGGEAPAPRPVSNLAILGAGFMGAGIGGTAVARARVDVRLRDTEIGRVQTGVATAVSIVKSGLRRRRITKHDYRRLRALISGGTDWAGFGRADVVIEAVFEDLEVKRQVFADLEIQTRPECVLASNTSTIPIARIAAGMRHPERILGMHYFSPVEKMPLLEVIVTEQTAPWATVTAVDFGRRMGKTVIVVRDLPGFWVNRILSPYLNEAGRLVAEGVPIEDIDAAMKRYGLPVGPITLLDEVGLDVAHKASGVMYEAFGDRLLPVDGMAAMVDAGAVGRKAGRGFYRYDKGKKRGVDSAVYERFAVQRRPVPAADIQQRLLWALLNEAALAVADGVVRQPRDGDIGAVFGIGFPPFRGGPLRQLDDIGAARAVDTLERLQQAYGDRFAPAPALRHMADTNQRYYST